MQCCPNIKTLHGCDHYEAFTDYITTPYPTGAPAYSVDQQTQDWNEMLCRFYIKHSGNEHKAILHKKKSMDLINEFEDNYFDFIFIDTYLSEEQIREEIPAWYKKVKIKVFLQVMIGILSPYKIIYINLERLIILQPLCQFMIILFVGLRIVRVVVSPSF